MAAGLAAAVLQEAGKSVPGVATPGYPDILALKERSIIAHRCNDGRRRWETQVLSMLSRLPLTAPYCPLLPIQRLNL